jgi:murein tripeptide amidase MpaA
MARLLILLALVAVAACDRVHFHGEKVFRVTPKNEEQVELLQQWQDEHNLDFWTDLVHPGIATDIRVRRDDVEMIEKKLKEEDIPYTIIIEDLEKEIEEEQQELRANSYQFSNGFNYYTYNRLDAIHTEVRRLASVHSDKASLFSAGTSFEKRDMLAVKISSGGAKPVIWIDGCIHAREWIACASVMNLLKQLLEPEPMFASRVDKVLAKYDLYILPVFNVDGYEFTHTGDRMWRKTRSDGTPCKGADPNRNWDSHWGGAGTSGNPCSDIYRGKHAFSEIEVKQVADKLTQLAHTVGVKSYWNIHAYSQLVLYPWSYTTRRAKDYQEIDRVAQVFSDGIRKINGKHFKPGQPSRILYSVAGGSMDWTYEKLGIIYSYAPEMRPTQYEPYGFRLPTRFIRPSETEFVNGILEAALAMK